MVLCLRCFAFTFAVRGGQSADQPIFYMHGCDMEEKKTKTVVAEAVPFLLQWYDYNRRILPWREEPTPYRVWVSEIMLQQTRVEAVKGYYDRFLSRLPRIKDLAGVSEEELLKLWEGLGYYNRVRNMQRAAQDIMEKYGGEMPAEYGQIRELPGIGDYTAGAIASIAFGLPYPAVDGNVLRVMSRLTGDASDISKDTTKRFWREELLAIMPERPGDFNQSLMELGATVCIPNGKPLCEKCPVMHLCHAWKEGREQELPVKAGKKERRMEKRIVYIISCDKKQLLHKRPEKGLLSGLWEYPNCLLENAVSEKELEQQLGQRLTVREKRKAKHIFSHVEWHMEGIYLDLGIAQDAVKKKLILILQEMCGCKKEEDLWVFAGKEEREREYSIPSAFDKFKQKGEEE